MKNSIQKIYKINKISRVAFGIAQKLKLEKKRHQKQNQREKTLKTKFLRQNILRHHSKPTKTLCFKNLFKEWNKK